MKRSVLTELMFGTALCCLLAPTSGLAQSAVAPAAADADQDDDEAADEAQDQIVVTGTSIRGISAVGSAALAITREDLAATGRNNPVDVMRELPQVQSLGFDESPRVAQNGSGNIQRGSTVNLRGLGSNATLLLIDGKRVSPTGNVFSFTEANQLPVSAIERIEVIADGASAIYGSDAVAGVVNYITRKNFSGLELSARGTTTAGYSGWGGSAVFGKQWGSGGFVIAYDHDERGEFLNGESPFLRQDLRPYGGADNRIRTNTATSSAPGNIVMPRVGANPTLPSAGNFTYYGVNAANPTAAGLRLNDPNLADSADYTSWLPKTTRNQASLTVRQDLADWLRFSGLAFYNRRDSVLHSYPQSGVRTLPASSPFYIAGVPGVAPGAPLTVAFSLFKDIGIGDTEIFDEQMQAAGNLVATLGAWNADFGINHSRNNNCANCMDALENNIDTVALQAALNNGSYNPFATAPASETVLRAILPSAFDRNRSRLTEYTLRLDGPLFDLPAGEVKAAFGASYMKLSQWRSAIGVKATSDVPLAEASRNIKAAYGEVYVPLVGEDMGVPAMQRLVINLALRTEDYSDAGSTTNPKIGLTWDVTDGVSLRGAWGKSFRAPNLIENNPIFFSRVSLITLSNLSGDPAIGLTNAVTNQTNVLNVAGSNADLVPETARNYSFGIDIDPSLIEGFRLSATYYNVKYKNQILGLQGFGASYLASAANRALYAPYITPAIQPATCVNGNRSTYNPLYLPALGRPTVATIDESNMCSARAITYTQNTNAANVLQDGIDVQTSYRFATGASEWTLSGSLTKILRNRTQIVAGGPVIDGRDIMNYPVSLRGRGSITWKHGPVTVQPALNYVGSYTNNLPITVAGVTQPVKTVPAWTTFDLTVGVDLEWIGTGWARGLDLNFNVRNLTDKDPPVVLSANGNAFDAQNANPYGAIATAQITKRF